MRRMLVALLLLLLIIAGWKTEEKFVNNACNAMLENVEKMKNARDDELRDLTKKTIQEWEKTSGILEMFIPHEVVDDININWAGYKTKIAEGNHTSAMVTLSELEEHFKEMQSKIKVNFQNIF